MTKSVNAHRSLAAPALFHQTQKSAETRLSPGGIEAESGALVLVHPNLVGPQIFFGLRSPEAQGGSRITAGEKGKIMLEGFVLRDKRRSRTMDCIFREKIMTKIRDKNMYIGGTIELFECHLNK